jgi:hypothetical protein
VAGLFTFQPAVNKVPPLHPYQHLLFVFLITAILTGVRWNHNVVLICVCLKAKEVGHFFMYLSPIYTSSFKKYLFHSIAHLLIGLFALLLFNFIIKYVKAIH